MDDEMVKAVMEVEAEEAAMEVEKEERVNEVEGMRIYQESRKREILSQPAE